MADALLQGSLRPVGTRARPSSADSGQGAKPVIRRNAGRGLSWLELAGDGAGWGCCAFMAGPLGSVGLKTSAEARHVTWLALQSFLANGVFVIVGKKSGKGGK